MEPKKQLPAGDEKMDWREWIAIAMIWVIVLGLAFLVLRKLLFFG